jgi:spermidine/putrescine transport system substrate-binding protein
VIEEYVNYISPVPAAKDFIDPSLADNELIFPTEEDLAKTRTFYAFKTPEEQSEWNALFQPIYQG